ncbi:MAG: insulinase family protein [Nannocystaceae bacterium]
MTHYFKDIPRGSQRPSSPTLAPANDRVRAHVERRAEDPLAQQRLIRIGWRTVSFDEEDRAALDVLSPILGGGKSARLRAMRRNDTTAACRSRCCRLQGSAPKLFAIKCSPRSRS